MGDSKQVDNYVCVTAETFGSLALIGAGVGLSYPKVVNTGGNEYDLRVEKIRGLAG